MEQKQAILELSGRIDSGNATEVETRLFSQLAGLGNVPVRLDASKLEYISSAGLRVILRIKKAFPDLKITDVSPEVYEIFEMTGFTEMMPVEKAYRVVDVTGCEVIGEGFNGKVYRIDRDNVVKTYKNADALSEIQHEREVARLALVLGVPTAISYDVVRVGDSYGSVFELLNAKSFSKILAEHPERMDFCVREYVDMLKKIHSIEVPEGKLPSIKAKVLRAAKRTAEKLPQELGEKLVRLVEEIPESNHMIHGDCHTKNIVLAGDEVLLIDMDTLSVGNPIFEFLYMCNAYIGYSEYDPNIILNFQGYSAEIAHAFWRKTLATYLETEDEAVVELAEQKIRVLSYAYLIDWSIRHPKAGDEVGPEVQKLRMRNLTELLGKVDSLVIDFTPTRAKDPFTLTVEASVDRLEEVLRFVNAKLQGAHTSPKTRTEIDLAVEEIFVNVASYAYPAGRGNAFIHVEITGEPESAVITIADRGIPYDPTKKTDPDVSLSAEERGIGGLGIFMTKKMMDEVSYEYKDGQNILTLKKVL